MRLRIRWAVALFCSVAAVATGRSVSAQSQQTGMMRNAAAPASRNANAEELPAGQMPAGQMGPGGQSQEFYPSGSGDVSFSPNGCYQGGCSDGYCGDNCCQPSCCSMPCCDSGGGWCGMGGGQFFFTADYLNVRASFSQATAFVRESLADGTAEYVPIEFDFESSYRFAGGYKLCCCGEQIRFMFTRMTSSGESQAFPGDIVPYETSPAPDGTTFIRADVDAKTFDLEWAKTIPLGGQCCDSCCGDACGDNCQSGCCTPCCGKCCPAWDITWSGGVRIADVGWSRTYERHDDTDFVDKISRPEMDFRGGGLRTGLEGRRYFGKDGWFSLYAKGDISLLFGDVNIKSTERIFDPTTPNDPPTTISQTFKTRQIIPVTEIEAGMTGQVTCHTSITAGYLMAAWHDLGFRDEPSNLLQTTVFEPPTSYDDANILGFDGFFARVEVSY